ncbi:MAG: hypothetical protein JO051_08845 [Acidobacteriaceae bacterium]|nr:hypothetical protein [Acidobacteriaceae bacterium]
MTPDDIDRILSSEAEVIPASGFTESVMDAVRREADCPQPIPFPWKRAIPAMAVWIAVLALLALEFVHDIYKDPQATVPAQFLAWMTIPWSLWGAGANWIALGVGIALISLTAIRRLISD